MDIKEYVLMACNMLGIEKNSKNIIDYEKAKRVMCLRVSDSGYQQAIKVLAEYIGV